MQSTLGVGSTFTLYLPKAEQHNVGATRSSESSQSVQGEGRCVLVVEDNESVGQFATQALGDLGFKSAWAMNAEEALEKLGPDGGGFDIVFSDVVMPGMGGIELAKRLALSLPDLPVVLASCRRKGHTALNCCESLTPPTSSPTCCSDGWRFELRLGRRS